MTDETPTPPAPFRVDAPGFYFMTEAQYHADPCPAPSLSSSIAHTLCNDAPVRAWFKHPRLNPDHVDEQEERFVVGTVAHQLVLEGSRDRVRVIEAADYRTKAAQELRDRELEAGNLPLLRKDYDVVEGLLGALEPQLAIHYDGQHMLRDGKPEVVAIWLERFGDQELWCRARIDYLRLEGKRPGIDDYKTTKGSANPEQVAKNIATTSMLMQAAFYRRGVQQLTGDLLPFRFVVQECARPYLLSVNAPGEALYMLAEKQLAFALETWATCLTSGVWPTYGTRTAYAELPPFVEEKWTRKEVAHAGLS